MGDRIAMALANRDRTWLAQATGIPASTLHDYVRGAMPSADRAFAIAMALNVSLEWLIAGTQTQQVGAEPQRIELPFFADASAMSGLPDEQMILPRRWLEAAFGPVWQPYLTAMPTHRLRGLPPPGSLVLCEGIIEVPLSEGGIYLLHLPEGITARRLSMGIDGKLQAGDDTGSALPIPSVDRQTPPRLIGRVLGTLLRAL